MRTSLLALSFWLALATSGRAQSCNCVDQANICEASARAEAIFVGSVNKVKLVKSKEDDSEREQVVSRIARIRVETVFKGKIGSEITIHSGTTSCDLSYQVGERWIFYASYDKETETWSGGGVCGRSRLTTNAANDLLYLQKLPDSAQQPRISGVIEDLRSDPEKGIIGTPLKGIKLEIVGKEQIAEVSTDRDGVYEVYGLPPGQYLVKPRVPPEWLESFQIRAQAVKPGASEDESFKVELTETSCVELNFPFLLDTETSLAGTVRDADGRPMPDVRVSLQPKGGRMLPPWQFAFTNLQGDYRLEKIPRGEYLIVVNSNGDHSSSAPFTRIYHPGVFNEESASILKFFGGGRLENYNIKVPPRTGTHVLQGRLLYADGRPVEHGSVSFETDRLTAGGYNRFTTQTDTEGRFSLYLQEELEGRLYGFIYPDQHESTNCPALPKLGIDAAPIVETAPLRLKITADLSEVRLKLTCN